MLSRPEASRARSKIKPRAAPGDEQREVCLREVQCATSFIMRARFLRASLLCVLATLCARALAKNEPKETDQELLARTLASRPTFPTIATLKPMNAWSGRKNMVLASGGDSSVHDIR